LAAVSPGHLSRWTASLKVTMSFMAKIILFFLSLFLLVVSCQAQSDIALFRIQVKSKTGYINVEGTTIIEPKFDDGWRFSEGLAPVLVGDKWGYIDKSGKIVIKPQFFEAWNFKKGIARVGVFFKSGVNEDNEVGYYSYVDKSGKLVAQTQVAETEFAEKLHNGLALFQTEGNMPGSRTGYIDKTGKIAIEAKYNYGEEFSENVACVSLNHKAGFIDTNGNVIIDFRFDSCSSFSEGLAAVRVGEKWGYIDKSGKMVVGPQFAEAKEFSDGVAVVRVVKEFESSKKEERYKTGENIIAMKSGKFAVIDRTGKMILQPRFVQIGDFSGGLAWVNLGQDYIVHGNADRWGYINKAGKFVRKSF
jgi:WG containing repeat